MGLVLDGVGDDDESLEGMPYVQWRFRVPAALHADADDRGVPRRVAELLAHLRIRYPDFVDFKADVDRDLTWRLYCAREVAAEYADLIGALEVALLPMQTEAAARIGAIVSTWAVGHDGRMIGTYSLPLTTEETGTWLLVRVGVAASEALDETRNGDLAREARRFGVRGDSSLLILPRPADPVFYVQIARCTVGGGINAILEERPDRLPDVAGDFRWVSRSPERLARAVKGSSAAWWPTQSAPNDDQ